MAFRYAVAAAALAVMSAVPSAQAVEIGGCTIAGSPAAIGTSDFYAAAACEGMFDSTTTSGPNRDDLRKNLAAAADVTINEGIIQGLGLGGKTDWQLVDEITFAEGGSGGTAPFTVAGVQNTFFDGSGYNLEGQGNSSGAGISNDQGSWTLDVIAAEAQDAAIALLNENGEWSVFLLSSVAEGTNGFWSTRPPGGFTAEKVGEGYNLDSMQLYISTSVPIPAAAPLLIVGVAGIALLRRRANKA